MQISTQYGFAFLCVPKCASTSIEYAISKYCNINFSGYPSLTHIYVRDFRKYILAYHEKTLPDKKIETFCILRDPLDWIESWYRYRAREALRNPEHPYHKNYTGDMSYNKFIKAYVSKGKRPSFADISTQYDFVRLTDGSIGVDRIFPMENLDLFKSYIHEKTGRKITLPRKNVSVKAGMRKLDLIKKIVTGQARLTKLNSVIPQYSHPQRRAEELDADLKKLLIEYLANDIAIYDLIRKYGYFDRLQHTDEISILLKP